MSYEPGKRGFGFRSKAMVLALAVLLLPMAIPVISAETNDVVDKQAAEEVRQLPWIEKTNPPVGATDVDPNLKEITITFDRDMGGGMSWTGNLKTFMPVIPEGIKPQWRDKRTCVLPVKLEKGQYYRLGINSKSHRNFKSKAGRAAPCSAIYFATRGASKAIQSRVRIPKIVKLTPENGSKDVDPKTKRLVVAFDMLMGEGMSWTGAKENFPQAGEGEAKWISGGKACALPVKLKPGRDYHLGINSQSHINFQSKWGVPIESVKYQFCTTGGAK